MAIRTDFLESVAAFCATHSMTERAFGAAAVGDPRFISRLRKGSGTTLTLLERAEKFCATVRAKECPEIGDAAVLASTSGRYFARG